MRAKEIRGDEGALLGYYIALAPIEHMEIRDALEYRATNDKKLSFSRLSDIVSLAEALQEAIDGSSDEEPI